MKIKVLVMDVDGTLTDGKIYMGQHQELFKVFDCQDGYAIHELLKEIDIDWSHILGGEKHKGILPVVITARESDIVKNRCKEMGVEFVFQGCKDKVKVLMELAERLKLEKKSIMNVITYPEIAYIGDDILDISCMKISGLSGCPNNAVPKVKKIADYACEHSGGDGAVREFIQWIIDKSAIDQESSLL